MWFWCKCNTLNPVWLPPDWYLVHPAERAGRLKTQYLIRWRNLLPRTLPTIFPDNLLGLTVKEPHFLSFKEQQFPHQVIPLTSAVTPSPHLSPSHSISLIWMPLPPNCLPSTAAPPPPFLTSSFVHSTLVKRPSEFGGLLLPFKFKLYYAQLAPSLRLDSFSSFGIALKIRGGGSLPLLRLQFALPSTRLSACLPSVFLVLSLPPPPHHLPPLCSGQRSLIYLFIQSGLMCVSVCVWAQW